MTANTQQQAMRRTSARALGASESTTDARSVLMRDARNGLYALAEQDPELIALIARERMRQVSTLSMVASSSVADPSVLTCAGAAIANLTTEGYPGARLHGGCSVADEVESLAIQRAKCAFKAAYANVQPHSCSTANQAIMFSLLQPGDTILGLDLKAGGHLTHGAKVSSSGKYFNAIAYGLDGHGLIDYSAVRHLAERHRPKMIICGASAYPREIRFDVFRDVADSVGAILLADVSHIAGLIVAGVHANPIDVAHITTTSTYKQLFGPRGGLILMGRDRTTLAPSGRATLEQTLQKAIFPFAQGTPDLAAVAAKARALQVAMAPEFSTLATAIVRNARLLARALLDRGYDVLTGGTDNHIVLVSLCSKGVTGVIAERALEECGIILNRNLIPGDRRAAVVCSGIRLGTNTLAYRGMGEPQVDRCVALIDQVLRSLAITSETDYELSAELKAHIRGEVSLLCDEFPLAGYGS